MKACSYIYWLYCKIYIYSHIYFINIKIVINDFIFRLTLAVKAYWYPSLPPPTNLLLNKRLLFVHRNAKATSISEVTGFSGQLDTFTETGTTSTSNCNPYRCGPSLRRKHFPTNKFYGTHITEVSSTVQLCIYLRGVREKERERLASAVFQQGNFANIKSYFIRGKSAPTSGSGIGEIF